MSRLHASLLIVVVCFALFRLSPRAQVYDSRFTLTASEQLLVHGTLGFDAVPERFESDAAPASHAGAAGALLPYQFERRGDGVRYGFPVGTPLLTLPYVALTRSLGWPVVDARGGSDRDRERRLQRVLAALLMAGFCVLVHATARLWLAPFPAALVTLAIATATPVWSTASRSLWSHSFAVVLLGAAVFLLCRARRLDAPAPSAAIASLLAWATITRPTLAIAAVGLALFFLLLRPRRELLTLVLVGLGWGCGFVLFSLWQYDAPVPPYYSSARLTGDHFGEALLGNLISPARGVLVFSPLLALVGYWLVRHRRALPDRPLAALALACCAAHWIAISAFPHWWGGWCYGPRLMTDTVPWWTVLGGLGLAARLGAPPIRVAALPRPELGLAAVLLAVGMVLHGIGAISKNASLWNRHQQEPGFAARLWDWREPQWLAWRTADDIAADAMR